MSARESVFAFAPSPTNQVRLHLLLSGTAATMWGATKVLGRRYEAR